MTNNNSNEVPADAYDRQKELQEFDSTKLGVKGLVDSSITQIPRIFHHPPETLFEFQQAAADDDQNLIPVIDMSNSRQELVQQIRDASSKFGFFQVINHRVPVSLLDRLLNAVKGFHELPAEEKTSHYGRFAIAADKGVNFFSNHDLFHSKAASWRDTLQIRLGPVPINPNALPDVCRDEVIEWDMEVKQLSEQLMGMLSEGLGLEVDRLKGMSYLGRVGVAANYYPPCPEPNKTVGIASHTDPGILTVLLQDQMGGLQVKYNGNWIDLKPVHGALVINIGDLFQIISNDEYKSGEHRVFANRFNNPRASIAVFFSPGINDNTYGPLHELVSQERPALYKDFKFSDFLAGFMTRQLEGKSMISYFKL